MHNATLSRCPQPTCCKVQSMFHTHDDSIGWIHGHQAILDSYTVVRWLYQTIKCQKLGFITQSLTGSLQIPEADALSCNKHVCVSREALLSHTNCPWVHKRDKMLRKRN